jgi:hypothetical protein
MPRHGLRVAGAPGVLDVLVCFRCDGLRIHRAGAPRPTIVTTTRAAEPLFDAVLRAHGLPAAP